MNLLKIVLEFLVSILRESKNKCIRIGGKMLNVGDIILYIKIPIESVKEKQLLELANEFLKVAACKIAINIFIE